VLNSIIVLAIFVVIGYLLALGFKIKGRVISAVFLAILLLLDYFIKDVNLFTILNTNIDLLTILEGLIGGILFRNILK
jgi:hypothetical protein